MIAPNVIEFALQPRREREIARTADPKRSYPWSGRYGNGIDGLWHEPKVPPPAAILRLDKLVNRATGSGRNYDVCL